MAIKIQKEDAMENGNKYLQAGLVWGLSLSSIHLIWLILILTDSAQHLMDFIFKLHMLNSPFQVQPFNWVFAAGLLLLTFTVGAFSGMLFTFYSDTGKE